MRRSELRLFLTGAALLGAAACAPTNGSPDPLRNSRKLIVPGHVSLYKNGAFRVPQSKIVLIPPGPDAWQLAGELAGIRARQSLEKSVEQAAQSVYIVYDGTKLSYRAASGIASGGDAVAALINDRVERNGVVLISRSYAASQHVVGETWAEFQASRAAGPAASKALTDATTSAAANLDDAARSGLRVAANSGSAAAGIARDGTRSAGAALDYGLQRFVKGYAAVPAEMKKHVREAGEQFSSAGFAEVARRAGATRAESSRATVDLMASAVHGYGSAVADDMHKARSEFDGAYQTTGVSLAALKSMRWVLQSLLGDAVIVPAAKLTVAGLGFIGVNAVAYPTIVVAAEGKAATQLAVEVGWDSGRSVYELTAPSAIAAVASIYALLDDVGALSAAGATYAGGKAAGYGKAALAKGASVVVEGGGAAAGKTVQYIGVPLASAGILVGGGTVGVAVAASGAAAGSALTVAGETGSATAGGFGRILAGTTFVGGTTASVGVAGGYAAYELSQAAVVPPGYELAGGIVLDYGTMSQFGAQTILAAADCSYLVLSLEGPRWVLYAVKGNLGRGEDLPTGTVLDLKKMQEAGEELRALPASREELRGAVDTLYDDLPPVQPAP